MSDKIRDLAAAEGIDALGFADAAEFSSYVLKGTRRHDPRQSLPTAGSIIVAGIYIGGMSLPAWEDPWVGRTSRLLLSGFFLDVVEPLQPIVDLLKQDGHQAMVCDGSREDGSILPLKLAAVRAGMGWQGKHSLLISKRFGTFLALGGIITDALLEPNTRQERDRCRDCDKCRQACPLAALDRPYILDKAKCLSYRLQAGGLLAEARDAMQNRVADCEICQVACPWNQKHLKTPLATARTLAFQEKIPEWEKTFHLSNLVRLPEKAYANRCGRFGSDIPYDLLQRNVRIALKRAECKGQAATDAKLNI